MSQSAGCSEAPEEGEKKRRDPARGSSAGPAEKLSEPDAECRRLGRYISTLYRLSQAHLSREFQVFGLGAASYPPLVALYRRDGSTQEELALHLCIDKAAVKRSVDELVEGGFVLRVAHETDGRSRRLMLTDKARSLRNEIEGVLRDWEESLTRGMDNEEKEEARDLLSRMAANATAED
jgi:DNA-binding MarR family transcriptional regulator